MRTDVPSVSADAPLGEVLDAVTSTRLNRAIVVDAERRVLGVVTDADLLRKLDPAGQTGLMGALMGRGSFRGETKITARDVMRTPPTTVPADTPVGAISAEGQHGLAARVGPAHPRALHTDLYDVLGRADLLRLSRASADR
jgi:CBS domain-containing protein